jgi:hypothetical protein
MVAKEIWLITAHYQTMGGNASSTRFEVRVDEGVDSSIMFGAAREKLERDKRYRFFGKLDMDADFVRKEN